MIDALGPVGVLLHREVELADSEKKTKVQGFLIKTRQILGLAPARNRCGSEK